MRHTILGILQTLGTVGAFVLAGVAAAALYPPGMPSNPPPDPAAPASDPVDPGGPSGETWLVDGYNVIQVALLAGRARDQWWIEERRTELLERADALRNAAVEGPSEVEVVFDGREPAAARQGARSVFAPSADEWILARVAESAHETAPPIVVTADRRLANRARRRGARIVTPADFLALCPGSHGDARRG